MTYTGRTLGIGLMNGKPFAFYLLCSRSFPKRKVIVKGRAVYIENLTETDNPYVSYPVVRLLDEYTVVTNGLQTDFIAQTLEWESPRKALIHVLDALDYERDNYSTPRIAGIIGTDSRGWLGFAGRDEFWVKTLGLKDGKAFVTATYDLGLVELDFPVFGSAEELAEKAMELPFENRVLAIGVVSEGSKWKVRAFP
ncbi:IMP cyclohydrolase [Thermococcus thioreducens]|uniref:IMP cyclohydrolase n=1 Tax=Thermococcus thioreducens TaxID=277988 RepID=A0A0Q2S6S8_9EURY|nr:IMP cyclohydrolase [Thermococcus thioreducens]ASJ12385.1 IMP cyclohydrolase [Thermococcus thioreducens]KQH83115.1 IMP cyclohydrolase [Thermococcus thioreducens]SEV91776.1 IMP cyclohydrolase [Thermococcus thioreducens]